MLKGREKILVEGNPLQSWPWTLNGTTVVAAVTIPEVVNNWRSVLQIKIERFGKKLDFESECYSVTGKVCYRYNSWVTGVYIAYAWQKFRRKNLSYWVIIWINLRSFGCFNCSTALWLPLDPSCKGNTQELAECFRPSLSPDAQNRAVAKNGSCIQIVDTALIPLSKSRRNTLWLSENHYSINNT